VLDQCQPVGGISPHTQDNPNHRSGHSPNRHFFGRFFQHRTPHNRLESGLEEAQILRLEVELEAHDVVAAVEEVDHAVGGHVEVGLGVHAAGEGEPDELEVGEDVLALGVAAGGHAAAFHGPHAGVDVESGGERLGGELVARHVGQEAFGVEEDAVRADRGDDGHAGVEQLLAEVFDLTDAGADVIFADRFFDADRHGFHITPGHAAVGVETFVDDDHVTGLLGDGVVVDGEEAAYVDEAVLLAGHGAAVGVRADLFEDVADGGVGVAGLALLDEPGVLDGAGGVEVDGDAVFVADGAGVADVLHGAGLTAGHVDVGFEGEIGDVVGADFVDEFGEFVDVDVALEGKIGGGVVGLVADDVAEGSAGEFLVDFGGGEVHVAGDDVSGSDERAAEEVFGAASLVGGDEVLVAVDLADGSFESVVVSGAGVGLVAEHDGGPLAVGHGGGAGVGEEVDVDVFGSEEECVISGFGDGAFAFFAGGYFEVFDHFDFVGFGPGPAVAAWAGVGGGLVGLGLGVRHGFLLFDPRRGGAAARPDVGSRAATAPRRAVLDLHVGLRRGLEEEERKVTEGSCGQGSEPRAGWSIPIVRDKAKG